MRTRTLTFLSATVLSTTLLATRGVLATSIHGTVWRAGSEAECGRDSPPGEARLVGLTLVVCDGNGEPLTSDGEQVTAQTDSNGEYHFDGLGVLFPSRLLYTVRVLSEVEGHSLQTINCLDTRNDPDSCVDTGDRIDVACAGADMAAGRFAVDFTHVTGCDWIVTGIDFVFCEAQQPSPSPPPVSEGCTPGFWRQPQHVQHWVVDPTTPFADVFEDAFPGMSLFRVVALRGRGLDRLGAHAVSAYLNALSMSYGLDADEVVAMFNDVYPGSVSDYEGLQDQLEMRNEKGCPLGGLEQIRPVEVTAPFRRGDSNATGEVDLADSVFILKHLFRGFGPTLHCPDSADANDDGAINLSDAIEVLQVLYLAAPPLRYPGRFSCGEDLRADTLDSCVYTVCSF